MCRACWENILSRACSGSVPVLKTRQRVWRESTVGWKGWPVMSLRNWCSSPKSSAIRLSSGPWIWSWPMRLRTCGWAVSGCASSPRMTRHGGKWRSIFNTTLTSCSTSGAPGKTDQPIRCQSASRVKPANWLALRMKRSTAWCKRRVPVQRTERVGDKGVFVATPAVWSIGIYTGTSPLHMGPEEVAHNPVLTAAQVTDIPATFVADPFMLRVQQTWSMFFEVMHAQWQRGVIGLATSHDGLRWRYERVVLQEAFHLSYPYVFAWQGAYYMVPETLEAEAIRVYRAVEFQRFRHHVVGTLPREHIRI